MGFPPKIGGRRISARERRLAKTAAALALLSLLYLYVVEPRVDAWATLENDLRDAAHRYQKLSVLVENEEIIRERYDRLSKTFASKGSESADAIHFYEFLGALDTRTSFRVRDIHPCLPPQRMSRSKEPASCCFAKGVSPDSSNS